MPKYDVVMRWGKYIDFGVIEAKDKEEAEELADDLLASGKGNLMEENEGEPEYEIEEVK
jgi:hypothetical protein